MKFSKSLPSIRISENEIENIQKAIIKFNSNNIIEMNLQGFRRLSYKVLSQMILNDEVIPISFEKK